MKFEDYLEGMLELGKRKREVRPDTLELPTALVQEFDHLYQICEKEGAEYGGPVFYDPEKRSVFVGPTRSGTATGINIATSNLDNNIGNVHAHPSESIGHGGGHSAHSAQDLLTFEKSHTKPFFIQFVVSGPKIYGMVYVKDISVFDESVKQFINGLKDKSASKAKNKLVEFVGGDEVYDAEIAQFDKPGQLEAYLEEVKRSMPGLGKLMEDLSKEECLAVAREFKYTFYEVDTGKLFSSRTMRLVT